MDFGSNFVAVVLNLHAMVRVVPVGQRIAVQGDRDCLNLTGLAANPGKAFQLFSGTLHPMSQNRTRDGGQERMGA